MAAMSGAVSFEGQEHLEFILLMEENERGTCREREREGVWGGVGGLE